MTNAAIAACATLCCHVLQLLSWCVSPHSPVAAGWGWHRTSGTAPSTQALVRSQSLYRAPAAGSAWLCHLPWWVWGPGETKGKEKVLRNSQTTICTRDHPRARITRNRQKAHPDSMRSLLSLEQIAEIKTKRQETPSAPRKPWLSHENLFFPSQVETANRFLCQTKEEFDKRRIFWGGRLLVVNEMEGNEPGKNLH